MDLKDKKVLVFGSGKSGIGAADLLGAEGARPVIYDGNEKTDREQVLGKQQEHTLWIFMLESFRKKCWRVLTLLC